MDVDVWTAGERTDLREGDRVEVRAMRRHPDGSERTVSAAGVLRRFADGVLGFTAHPVVVNGDGSVNWRADVVRLIERAVVKVGDVIDPMRDHGRLPVLTIASGRVLIRHLDGVLWVEGSGRPATFDVGERVTVEYVPAEIECPF